MQDNFVNIFSVKISLPSLNKYERDLRGIETALSQTCHIMLIAYTCILGKTYGPRSELRAPMNENYSTR